MCHKNFDLQKNFRIKLRKHIFGNQVKIIAKKKYVKMNPTRILLQDRRKKEFWSKNKKNWYKN